MELKIYRDTALLQENVCDSKLELPLETEILIPDYLPPVFKIVKTLVHRVVLQKQLQAGRLQLEGYFRIEVLYQGEDQNLCTVEQKVAFSRQQDVKGAEQAGDCRIHLTGETQYVNCRALSPRRLDLRGAYDLRVQATCEAPHEIITALSENGIRQKNCPIPVLHVYATREKQFTLEEDTGLEQAPEAVLRVQATAEAAEVRIVAGKAVAKGQINADILYRNAGGFQLLHRTVTLPFQQVLELEDAKEGCECQMRARVVGSSVFGDSAENGQTRLSCTCLLTVVAMQRTELFGVADCFSTQMQTETAYQTLTTETLLETVSNTVDVQTEGKLPDDSLQVLECFAECLAPELLTEKEKTAIRGRAMVHLICKNALGEIECYDKTCEYFLPRQYEAPVEELTAELDAECKSITFSQKDSSARAELRVAVSGHLCRKVRNRLVESVECTQPLEDDTTVALRVYYAEKGEAVFDIAGRYHAAPEEIASLAGIEGEELTAATRLLIPQTR